MKKIKLILLSFLACGSLVASDFKSDITFNGSSSLAPVISKISSDFISEYQTWDKVNSNFTNTKINIYVSSGGSGTGIKSVVDKVSDFGMVAREVKDSEKAKMSKYQEFILAQDALTISLNKDNPYLNYYKDISTQTLQKIFSGEYKYWSDIDKRLDNKEIVVVVRDLGGGAHEVFQKSVMKDLEVKEDVIIAPSMGALVKKITENKYAIGYASFGVYNQNKDKLEALNVDGIEPSVENILNNSYFIKRPLLVIKDGDLSEQEKAFIDYIYSKKGKKSISDNGYIPVK
ncbi:phosphate ABC transporter substrate-binding protein [Campylobacter sp. MG1]|uniref:phosphate ABC transporter substrate-binding protein n=1 Tax=Campylobacter sp. MG1 TaxID=2976332 RepID=UPI00226C7A29|nr:phosphate ABC transporter substrate-binding protein [Campylobacter sp. MG1]